MKINLGQPWRIGYASHFGGAVRVFCLGWLRIKIYSRQFARDMKAIREMADALAREMRR